MHRNHPQKQSSVVSFQLSRDNRTDHCQLMPRTIPHGSLSLSTHNISPLNAARAAGSPGIQPLATGQTCNATRPETHQNLINPDKEPNPPFPGATTAPHPRQGAAPKLASRL